MLSSRYSEDTIRDLDLQYEWYAENAGEDVAERYLAAMEKTRLSLCQQPDLGRICHFRSFKLANLRCIRMEGAFGKHLIFYRLLDGSLYVFRVLHGMRDLPRRLLEPLGVV
jgi:plasmid stabilization system protein ParE